MRVGVVRDTNDGAQDPFPLRKDRMMRRMRTLLGLALVAIMVAPAAGGSFDEWLPENTIFYASVEDVSAMKTMMKDGPFGALMAEFRHPRGLLTVHGLEPAIARATPALWCDSWERPALCAAWSSGSSPGS